MFLTQTDLQDTIFLVFSVTALASALFIVNSKNVFYAAVSLAFLGLSIAVLIADLNPAAYSLYSVFHIILYVGATVVFLSVSLVMFRGLEVREIRTPWAPVISLLAAVAFFSVLVLSTSSIAISAPPSPDLQTLGERMISQYWFPAIVLIVGLLTTMIEAIALARRD
ncbi:MAG: NADH-quinone oxidoreductase subunit J [Metallosphaera yellowstonensis]|jgi:NADH-quinone oxidoreductase subunit J|uniref:NADH:ubiquinone oxidoreductase subunit 6 (Chain J) n=1 Tax=Metallosphaera yellowstonensis MK1 TaxID=671065 RepID=H2C9H6_9CREN|nr:NADH-quinone oxidoreductase subunit J [Metallosphaera yellowstonensis]EHP68802.1 NADH:ubiquinone oxidoreductase subunit 6 (chain J) [Metallosphaera yellowstonensis MK1]